MSAFFIMETWKLWQCLSSEALAKLIQYQWKTYGQKLDLLLEHKDYAPQIESLSEIDKLMRQPPQRKR